MHAGVGVLQGRNAARFRRNFAGTPWVRVPLVEWSLTSPMVLTMEFMPGAKISDVAALRGFGLDTKIIAGRATEAYLTQILCATLLPPTAPLPGQCCSVLFRSMQWMFFTRRPSWPRQHQRAEHSCPRHIATPHRRYHARAPTGAVMHHRISTEIQMTELVLRC